MTGGICLSYSRWSSPSVSWLFLNTLFLPTSILGSYASVLYFQQELPHSFATKYLCVQTLFFFYHFWGQDLSPKACGPLAVEDPSFFGYLLLCINPSSSLLSLLSSFALSLLPGIPFLKVPFPLFCSHGPCSCLQEHLCCPSYCPCPSAWAREGDSPVVKPIPLYQGLTNIPPK